MIPTRRIKLALFAVLLALCLFTLSVYFFNGNEWLRAYKASLSSNDDGRIVNGFYVEEDSSWGSTGTNEDTTVVSITHSEPGMTTYYQPVYRPDDTQEPKSHEIVILLASNGKTSDKKGGQNVFLECLKNRIMYAKAHNYAFEYVNVSTYDVPPVWAKMPAILATMDKYPNAKWVWCLDQDALLMNRGLSLQDNILNPKVLLKSLLTNTPFSNDIASLGTPDKYRMSDLDNIGLILSKDLEGLNAGSFFVRATPLMRMFLDMWTEPSFRTNEVVKNEQELLEYFAKHHPELTSHVGLVSPKKINSFDAAEEYIRYTEGDLVIHFAGCWVENRCEELWNRYYDMSPKDDEVHL
ncbi:alpha-1,2-galactosyltransferase gmh3 [Schizosaccharomyces japonicus yFS275]|uniref:Alpha-1,2-galactosyltransferase gmh3 n=1 Tax=Schizosaccharomyces japonicus (strain yFS275 / FY16936) TaxID=402676 RepID=B6JZD8_SCHJY|nr:alpha-1,2-galactosyltransferase gmh3 [Schizosaccharomyces japonicus yFS275]EEB06906.1 alpha-1,2-galactosyltransferase gmh3 [Schizosaccharomyces japonicus yFS275]